MPTAVFTIVSNNYLHFARTLFAGVALNHPECERICVVVDRDPAPARAFAEEFAVVHLDELGLPEQQRFAFRYGILELNTAVKPWVFTLLLARGHSAVVYLDPDISLYRPMSNVFERLADDADLVLTPHLLDPVTDAKIPSELDIRRAGTYNLGFCALANRPNAQAFLRWWQDKLVDRCVVDFAAGIFVDQSWIDLVPGLFPRVAILRHRGYNVAYWNLAQRRVEREPSGWTARGEPLVFFHFSGLDPRRPEAFSKHQNRYTLDDLGLVRELILDYAERVLHNDLGRSSANPYGYGVFDDGITTIPDCFRAAYRADAALQDLLGDDPFAHPEILTTRVPGSRAGHPTVTYAMWALWLTMPEVRAAFDLSDAGSVAHFEAWFENEGHRFYSANVVERHRSLRAEIADPHGRRIRLPHGWFARDGDASSFGVWTAPDAGLPCLLQGDADVMVEGTYFADLVERQTGSPACRFTIEFQGRSLLDATLTQSGLFVLRARVENADTPGLQELRFRCSAHFVPEAIGLNDDRRQLAWRARRIALGDQTLLDSRQEPPVAPLSRHNATEGVNLVGYLAAESGIGESVRSFARGCDAVGIRFSTFDVGHQNANRQTDDSLRRLGVEDQTFRVNVLHVNADQTQATREVLPPSHRTADVTIAYWHWEQPQLPLSFLPSFEGLTEVWVPSGFVRDAVASIAPLPVFKVPHVVEFPIPVDAGRARFSLPEGRFLFLVMYDFDSYQDRKNPQAAVDAYRQAFASRTDTGLVIKTINAGRHPQAHRELLQSLEGLSGIHCIDDYLTRADVYALMASCDALISLHRSEGFGLCLAEMMYLGKPVIATGWSGNMEFMTPMNSFPIEFALRPLADRLGVYEASQLWAEADVGHASHALRRVVEDADLRHHIGAAAATHMRRFHSAAHIGAQYRHRLALVGRPLR